MTLIVNSYQSRLPLGEHSTMKVVSCVRREVIVRSTFLQIFRYLRCEAIEASFGPSVLQTLKLEEDQRLREARLLTLWRVSAVRVRLPPATRNDFEASQYMVRSSAIT